MDAITKNPESIANLYMIHWWKLDNIFVILSNVFVIKLKTLKENEKD